MRSFPVQMITLKKGSRVRWYVFALGDVNDLHTPHWHGNNVYVNGQRDDVINLLPATQVRFLESMLLSICRKAHLYSHATVHCCSLAAATIADGVHLCAHAHAPSTQCSSVWLHH